MKKKQRKVLFSVLLMFCLLLNCMNAIAADEHLGETVDGSVLTDEREAEMTVYSRLRGVFLSNGKCKIQNQGNHMITVTGSTDCYVVCDKVKVTLVVERLVNGNWQSYKVIGTKTAYNNHTVTKTKTLTVAGGYYYRVISAHVAIEGDKVESLGGFTNGIWVK